MDRETYRAAELLRTPRQLRRQDRSSLRNDPPRRPLAFLHIFNRIYVSAYETIFFVERNFGPSLRQSAMDISRERFLLREQTKAANTAAGDHHAHKDKD